MNPQQPNLSADDLERWRRKAAQFRRDQELLNRLPQRIAKLLEANEARIAVKRWPQSGRRAAPRWQFLGAIFGKISDKLR
jgi:hypothetical protein